MAQPELQVADTQILTNVLQEAVFTASEKSIAGQVFNIYDMSGTPGLTAQIPVYPEISASAPAQTAEVAESSVAIAQVDLTAAEIAARVDVSDLLAESTARNMGSDVGVMLGGALGEKIDTDAFALFTESNITNNVGGSGSEITPETILKAVYTLRSNSAPTDADGDYICVLHPSQMFNVAKVLTNAGFAASGAAGAISNVGNNLLSSSAFVGRLYNVKMFQSTQIAADSSATDALGAVFSPLAFAHMVKRPIRIETQRDISRRLTEYVATTARANAVVKDSYAVLVRGDKQIN